MNPGWGRGKQVWQPPVNARPTGFFSSECGVPGTSGEQKREQSPTGGPTAVPEEGTAQAEPNAPLDDQQS